jgi:uncharacterized protein YukE
MGGTMSAHIDARKLGDMTHKNLHSYGVSGKMASVHITTAELDALPSAVAALAIVGAYLGVHSTNRSQVRLARGTYDRDRRAETYIDLLKGVQHRNAQLDDTYTRQINQKPRTPTRAEIDFTSDVEVLFAARLMAYASPEVDKLWGEFALATTDLDNYMIALREKTGLRPVDWTGDLRQQLEQNFEIWKSKREELQDAVRRELR